ncbi:UDP-N-acetylmuramate dehydrogenase [Tamaricihabitans halophyticus]|uniref:UDP-N-acetylmuramate dehydrogenase n=1 Tax=Tamaricihabitans halophyticus TaxID=1262583 RepID=UPI001FB24540|nr:UDP-N-acetylmuramate dehydrogenase [Tamaricihabitans halophyticus]
MTSAGTGTEVRAEQELRDYTTLRLGGPAARFVSAASADELVHAVRAADAAGDALLLLGGGSNLVIADEGFPGTVVRIANRGWSIEGDLLTAEAGQDWDELVAALVADGYGGLECLAGIPGLVGATPVQNVGAYGVEVSSSLHSVDLLERASGELRTVPAAELGLAYRTSVLKGTDRAVVLRVRLRIATDGQSAPIQYAELARTLGVSPGARVPAERAREAVLGLRRSKGMVLDPADQDTWSAGSFFTNPIVPDAELAGVLERIAGAVGAETTVPRWPADGGAKLSAAWLIERAGFGKGYPGPGGRVSLSTKHTLALTNRGTARTADLLTLAGEVRDGVFAAFGVVLRPEPLLIGCAL